MAVRVTMSKRHQIVVPASVRDQLRIQSGDHLIVEVRDGYAVLIPDPLDYSRRLRGLHREVWEGIDAQEYVRQERAVWKG